MAPDLVLVPLKFRKPKFHGDSTIAYFNFYEIKDCFMLQNTTFIGFKNGFKLPVLWKKRTVDDHLQRAHLAALAQRKPIIPLLNIVDFLLAVSICQDQDSSYRFGS